MKTLESLISSEMIRQDEEIYFVFKQHIFRGKLSEKGMIYACTWTKPCGEISFVFYDRAGFSSLTSWTDSCIQELLHEYVTRFSSWKRVKCSRTNTPLGALRETSKVVMNDTKNRKPNEIEKELCNERKKNIYLTQQLQLKNIKIRNYEEAFADFILSGKELNKDILAEIKNELRRKMKLKSSDTASIFQIQRQKKAPVPVNRNDNLVEKVPDTKTTQTILDSHADDLVLQNIIHLVDSPRGAKHRKRKRVKAEPLPSLTSLSKSTCSGSS